MASDQNGVRSREVSPEFTIDYDESRPYVQEYPKAPKFNTGDKVLYQQDKSIRAEGPFYGSLGLFWGEISSLLGRRWLG
ncbi:hypothetical protein CEP52_005429 [Fusarium oligoseptatum]|uniref:Uncharacterized protein n=1 Tax=Fusarium oligoseptatum TaxID=2604345 RepID=A0A428TYE7_9HYPO|nr:hypothetical protein CEP52_005429 [Fusarium oligoseptatum]